MRWIFCLLFAALQFEAIAQRIKNDSIDEKSVFVRFNPLQLIDLNDPTVSFGGEYRMHSNWSAAVDAGLVFYSNEFRRNSTTRGLLLRPALRYFPNGTRFFLDLELHYKFVNHRMADWIGRNVVNGVPAYEEYGAFTLRKNEIGANIKAGRLIELADKIWLELYIGLGVTRRKFMAVNNPEFRFQMIDRFGFPIASGETNKIPMLPAGIRLLFKVN